SDNGTAVAVDAEGRPLVIGGDTGWLTAWRLLDTGAADAAYANGTMSAPGRIAITAPPGGSTGEYPHPGVRVLFDGDKPVIAAMTAVLGNSSAVELQLLRLLGDDTIMRDGFED